MTIDDAVFSFLRRVRAIRATGAGTDERSFYPAVNALLTDVGGLLTPRRGALSDPAGIEGHFPDVAMYELASQVLVLPVEVKPAEYRMEVLLSSEQAKSYARSFGGGMVLLTNLRAFVLAQLNWQTSELTALDRIDLVSEVVGLDQSHPSLIDSPTRLLGIIESGCSTTHRPLSSARSVARLLAWHAQRLCATITDVPDRSRLLRPIYEAFNEGLSIELSDDFLIPTVVQTLVYGIFAAWLQGESDESEFDWRAAAYRLDVPIFAEILHACLRPDLVRECDLFPRLDAMARVLTWVDRASFSEQFNGGAIEYFYEPFLAEFDSKLRDALGVWYTPAEIARYQVERVDHHLRHDLGIAEGLADDSVIVLDPASGTGTYLSAALEAIYRRHLSNNLPAELAAAKTRESATTRVIGFEILPAAFLISHLHIGRRLVELGAPLGDGERLRVYLTNSLVGWNENFNPPSLTMFPDLVGEIEAARRVKQTEPVLAILGNPPYQGYSTAETSEEKEMMRDWIDPLQPIWGVRKHRMNDLYVRFWRMAIHRITELTGRGVISFISNRKWLGGRSYPTMRESVVLGFQKVVVDDLHGDYSSVGDGSSRDGSIFTTSVAGGIRVGTAIVSAVRSGEVNGEAAAVSGRDFFGSGSDKRRALVELAESEGSGIDEGLTPRPTSRRRKWCLSGDSGRDFAPIDDYFDFGVSGVQTLNDRAILADTRDELVARMRDFYNADLSWQAFVERHPQFERDGAEVSRNSLLNSGEFNEHFLVRFLYKPMDARWLYWERGRGLIHRPRPELMRYLIGVSGQWCLVVPQTRDRAGAARPMGVTEVPGHKSAFEDAQVFPLFAPGVGQVPGQLGHAVGADERRPNIASAWISAARAIGCEGSENGIGELIFFALLGVGASAEWLATQAVEAGDFPEIPIPSSPEALSRSAAIGRAYAALCDPDCSVPGVTSGRIEDRYSGLAVPDVVAGPSELRYGTFGSAGGRRQGNDVCWDADHAWRNIPPDVWDFGLSGFRPLPKWLSYRVGTAMTAADREHFTLIARRVAAILDTALIADDVFRAAARAPLDPSTGID